jgi:hypothetical protein
MTLQDSRPPTIQFKTAILGLRGVFGGVELSSREVGRRVFHERDCKYKNYKLLTTT